MRYKVRIKDPKGKVVSESVGDFVDGVNITEIKFDNPSTASEITHFSVVDTDGNEFTGPLRYAVKLKKIDTPQFTVGSIDFKQ